MSLFNCEAICTIFIPPELHKVFADLLMTEVDIRTTAGYAIERALARQYMSYSMTQYTE